MVLLASCRFLRFIRDHEKGDSPSAEAAAEVKLTQEQIQEAGKQFGITLQDAHALLSMRKTMQRDRFRDYANACGYLQILQNALVKGQYEDRSDGLWKQAVVCRQDDVGNVIVTECAVIALTASASLLAQP